MLEYRDQGYLPDAMFNFLGLLGWSLDDKTEIISREQFIEHFTLDRVVKNPAVFNVEKLTWMNGVYIREMPEDRLVDLVAERLDADLPESVRRPVDRAVVARIVPLIRERIKLLTEIREYCDFFFVDELHYAREELLGKAFSDGRCRREGALDAAIARSRLDAVVRARRARGGAARARRVARHQGGRSVLARARRGHRDAR